MRRATCMRLSVQVHLSLLCTSSQFFQNLQKVCHPRKTETWKMICYEDSEKNLSVINQCHHWLAFCVSLETSLPFQPSRKNMHSSYMRKKIIKRVWLPSKPFPVFQWENKLDNTGKRIDWNKGTSGARVSIELLPLVVFFPIKKASLFLSSK